MSSLTLKSLLAKRIQRSPSELPCKLRYLKFPHGLNHRTTKILSVLSNQSTWDTDTQSALDVLSIKLSPKVVREVIKSLNNAQVAVGFFHWASDQAGYKHNTKSYSAIVRLAGECGDLELMHSLILQMHKEGCPPTPYFLADIMMAYGKLNMVREAFLVFEEMKNAGCPPNLFVHNCLISILVRAGYLDGARKVYDMMCKTEDCGPDAVTYNMLIDTKGKCGDILGAQILCVEMMKRGLKPNEKSYASIIGSLRRAGKIEKACDVFDQVKGKRKLANLVTYTEIIRGLGKAGKVEKASQVFEELEDSGCNLDVVVYNIMIDILVKHRKLTEAWKLFVSMPSKQCYPNVVTYNSLIHGFCMAKRTDEALRWYEDMQRNGVAPDSHTFATIITGLCKAGQVDAAYTFLMGIHRIADVNVQGSASQQCNQGECLSSRMVRSVVAHNAMVDGLIKAGDIEKACAHFRYMEEIGCSLDVFSYSIIINGLGNAGKPRDALNMYRKMKRSCLKPNLVTLNTLINCLGKADMIFELHDIVKEMTLLGLKPDIITYTSLLPVVGKDSKVLYRTRNAAAVKCRFDHVLGVPNINQ